MSTLQAPLLEQTISAVNEWMKENPNTDKLPQRLGDATIKIEGKTEKRYNLTYPYWMIQRLQEKVEHPSNCLNLLEALDMEFILEPLDAKVSLKKARLYRN